jgi:hypothetical protein
LIEERVYQVGEGRMQIKLRATITSDGLVVQIFGGDRTHIGALALSLPAPSLNDPGLISCSTTVVPITGHKDDEVAKPVAEDIARSWGSPVLTVVGIHVDRASKRDIDILKNNCKLAAAELINDLRLLKNS